MIAQGLVISDIIVIFVVIEIGVGDVLSSSSLGFVGVVVLVLSCVMTDLGVVERTVCAMDVVGR